MTSKQFTESLNEVDNLLYSFALRLTSDHNDAKDLMQDTAIKAFRARNRFAEGTNFKAWITTIMRNTFVTTYQKRRTRRHVNISIVNAIEIADKRVVGNDGEQLLWLQELVEVFDGINEMYSVPFMMSFEGYQYHEIAAHLNLPMGTVKHRIFTARVKMKKLIACLQR